MSEGNYRVDYRYIVVYFAQVCGKAFNSRDNRNAHRFVHSDKKPYECLVCGMGFMRKPLLYNHMQTQVTTRILENLGRWLYLRE